MVRVKIEPGAVVPGQGHRMVGVSGAARGGPPRVRPRHLGAVGAARPSRTRRNRGPPCRSATAARLPGSSGRPSRGRSPASDRRSGRRSSAIEPCRRGVSILTRGWSASAVLPRLRRRCAGRGAVPPAAGAAAPAPGATPPGAVAGAVCAAVVGGGVRWRMRSGSSCGQILEPEQDRHRQHDREQEIFLVHHRAAVSARLGAGAIGTGS